MAGAVPAAVPAALPVQPRCLLAGAPALGSSRRAARRPCRSAYPCCDVTDANVIFFWKAGWKRSNLIL